MLKSLKRKRENHEFVSISTTKIADDDAKTRKSMRTALQAHLSKEVQVLPRELCEMIAESAMPAHFTWSVDHLKTYIRYPDLSDDKKTVSTSFSSW